MPDRVVVAMSGGVDSSVAAARLKAEGHDVIGVTLHLWDYPDDGSVKGRCCAPEDVHDARRVADRLGFPHFVFDRRELFERTVVSPFVQAYLEGETPSPCVRCNRGVKVPQLLELAARFEARFIATGHYARIDRSGKDPVLCRAHDPDKDQSYFLHMLPPAVLTRLWFPLGGATKAEVRAEAAKLDLPGAHKGESQELCFVPTGRYDAFVAERAPEHLRPGPIVDSTGRKVGEHAGIHRFTVGQRKNLGVALGARAYVAGLEAQSGTVRLGTRSEILAKGAVLEEVRLQRGVSLPLACQVRVRYRGHPVAATVHELDDECVAVTFDEAVPAVVKGQFCVFYDGDRVLGGGLIKAADPKGEPC